MASLLHVLHVLGKACFGDREKAIAGAKTLAGILRITTKELCTMILERTEMKITDLIIAYIFARSWGTSLTGFLTSRHDHPYLRAEFSLTIPIIGIGAAAAFFLPGVARRLSTSVSFPPFARVGSAVGAGLTGLESLQSNVKAGEGARDFKGAES